jgi:membrane protease YdiL (CAAX protease family)
MKTIKAFIESHPLLTYFALAFAISWGGVLMVVGPGGFPGTQEQYETLLPFVGLALLAGPPIAGILLTGLLYGRAGFRDLLTRMTRWRVGARWYAVAFLTAPILFMVVLLALSLISPIFLPSLFVSDDKATLLLVGIVGALIAGFLEELGWTGFATPRLLARHGVLVTGLIVGVLWGAWHFLTNAFWASGTSLGAGALPLALFLTVRGFDLLVGQMPAYRVLMVWVYDRTGGSLLVAILMHASLSASTFILMPLAISGVPLLTYLLASSAAAWVVVGAVGVAQGGHLSRRPPPRRAA